MHLSRSFAVFAFIAFICVSLLTTGRVLYAVHHMLTASEIHIDFIQMIFAMCSESDGNACIGATAALIKLYRTFA